MPTCLNSARKFILVVRYKYCNTLMTFHTLNPSKIDLDRNRPGVF